MICRGSILVLVGLSWLGVSVAVTSEYQLKAAYVVNFARFVEWPNPESLREMTICVHGKDPFGGFLDEAVRGKLAQGRPMRIVRLAANEENWAGCQVLFVGLNKRAQVESILSRLQTSSILTIGESAEFVDAGGMIGLVVDQGHVRFDINVTALTDAHLKTRTQVIDMGRRVVGSKR